MHLSTKIATPKTFESLMLFIVSYYTAVNAFHKICEMLEYFA